MDFNTCVKRLSNADYQTNPHHRQLLKERYEDENSSQHKEIYLQLRADEEHCSDFNNKKIESSHHNLEASTQHITFTQFNNMLQYLTTPLN